MSDQPTSAVEEAAERLLANIEYYVGGADASQAIADLDTIMQAARADAWKQAVDDQLVVLESTADSFATPREALQSLITWHCQVALDPTVSSDVQALIAKDREQAARAAAAQPVAWMVYFRRPGNIPDRVPSLSNPPQAVSPELIERIEPLYASAQGKPDLSPPSTRPENVSQESGNGDMGKPEAQPDWERIIGHRNGDEAVLVKCGDAPAVWYERAQGKPEVQPDCPHLNDADDPHDAITCVFCNPGPFEPEVAARVVPDDVLEALNRLIENAAPLGPASHDDATRVSKWLRSLVAAAQGKAQGEPEQKAGWRLVPVEPTTLMRGFAVEAFERERPGERIPPLATIYRAMIEAAPPAPAQEQG
ncbi:hypothetical protein BH09PSE6_BH09PSE6_17920 [soil metagenome]